MCLTIVSPVWSFVFCLWLHQAPYVHDLVQADAFQALQNKGRCLTRACLNTTALCLHGMHTLTPTKWMQQDGFALVRETASLNTVRLDRDKMAVFPWPTPTAVCTDCLIRSAVSLHTPPMKWQKLDVIHKMNVKYVKECIAVNCAIYSKVEKCLRWCKTSVLPFCFPPTRIFLTFLPTWRMVAPT